MYIPILSIEMFGFGGNKNQEENNNVSTEIQALQCFDKPEMDHQEEKEFKIPTDENNNNQASKKFNPFQNLKFSGLTDIKHPKRFIEYFEFFARHENLSEYEKLYYFIQSFVGDAENWINSCGLGTYEELKDEFLKFYWSSALQKSFLKFLKDGEYNENCGLSMTDYFFKYVNYAKFLDEALAEEDIVLDLLNHFKVNEIKNLIKLVPVRTIDEALDVLIKVEDMQNYESSSEDDSENEKEIERCDFRSFKKSTLKLNEEHRQTELIILRFLVCMLLIFLSALLFFTLFVGHSSEQETISSKKQKLWAQVQNLIEE